MSSRVCLSVNATPVHVPEGATVAVAIALAGGAFRTSRGGEPRAPLCGMGVCFECRVRIDGIAQLRACMTPAREGMEVCTDG